MFDLENMICVNFHSDIRVQHVKMHKYTWNQIASLSERFGTLSIFSNFQICYNY